MAIQQVVWRPGSETVPNAITPVSLVRVRSLSKSTKIATYLCNSVPEVTVKLYGTKQLER